MIRTFLVFLILCIGHAQAQVGINTTSPKAGTSLQIDGDSGVLINRVELLGTDDTATIPGLDATYEGLMVYNTDTNGSGATTVVPGFYYWSGTQWQPVNQSGANPRGWVQLLDGDYTQTISFTNSPDLTDFSNFVNIDLDFSGGTDAVLDTYAPDGFAAGDFFDNSASRLTPLAIGDQIIMRLQFDAAPLQNNGVLVLQIDIGANDIAGDADDIVIFQKSIPLVRGGGRITNVSETILIYQLGTFLANGAKIRMAYTRSNNNTGSSCTVDNFGLVLSRL